MDITDSDALSYINAVEISDGQSLEIGVKNAIFRFVAECKFNNLWTKIAHCLLLAGPRQLNSLFIPLKGTTPTNNGFVGSNYNRKTLQGNGSSFLELNVNNNDFVNNNHHIAIHKTISTGSTAFIFGDTDQATESISMMSNGSSRHRNVQLVTPSGGVGGESYGFFAISRIINNSQYVTRHKGVSQTSPFRLIQTTTTRPLTLFKAGPSVTTAGISFYSQGTSITTTELPIYEQIVNKLIYDVQAYSA